MAIRDLIESLKKKRDDAMWQLGVNQNNYGDKSVGYKVVEPIANAQKWLENPTSRIKLGNDFQYKQGESLPVSAGKIAGNFAKGTAESVLTEPVKVIGDVGRGIGSLITRDQTYRPASFSTRLGENVTGQVLARTNPFEGIGRPVAGKWNVGGRNIPDFGVSESPIAETGRLAVGAFEPVFSAMGAKNPKAVLGYLGASGILGGGVNKAMGGDFKSGALSTMINTAPTIAPSAGFLRATNKFVEAGKIANPLFKIPIKSGLNVLQGVGQDQLIRSETTPLSVTIDALAPHASDAIGAIGKVAFKNAEEAIRAGRATILEAVGKKLRNNKGLFTTKDKFIKGTRAYVQSDKARLASAGLFSGIQPYQDEQGNWRVRFNTERALTGAGLMYGGVREIGKMDLQGVTKSIDRIPKYKNYSDEVKSAIVDEARRLAEGVKGVQIIQNGTDGRGIRVSMNDDWYRRFYSKYGRQPSNEVLFDLAEKNLRTGEVDGMYTDSNELKAINEFLDSGINGNKKITDLPTAPTTDPLIAEARKYKSAEEFKQAMYGGKTQYGDYSPNVRANIPAGYTNITELGVNPNEMVTIYRGIDDLTGKVKRKINDGDFVTTDFDSALSYTGDPKNVVEMKVKAKTLYNSEPKDFIDEPFYTGAEYIYTTKNTKALPTDSQLTSIYNQAWGGDEAKMIKDIGGLPEAMSQKQIQEQVQPRIEQKTSSKIPVKPVSTGLSSGLDDNTSNLNSFDRTYAKFIADRDIGKTTATQRASSYAKIPTKIARDVIDYMENVKTNVSDEVKGYAKAMKKEYQDLYKEASEVADRAGMSIGQIENYVPHFWKEKEDDVIQMFMSAKKNFPNAKDRVFPTYAEGLKLGLTPKFSHPAQIMEQYVKNLEKFRANVDFITQLKKDKLLVPQSPYVPRNYVEVKAEGIPKDLYAPVEVARELARIFNPENQSGFAKNVSKFAKFSSGLQDLTLSGGLPATPLNAFTLAQVQKELISGRITSPIRAVYNSLTTGNTVKFFNKNAEQIKKLQSRNVPIYSDYSVDNMLDQGTVKRIFGDGIGNAWSKIVNEPTFKRFMPMLQINLFNDIEKQALKSGMSADQAVNVASKAVKNFYGIVSSDVKANRSQLTEDLKTSLFFAPHYRESMVNMWVNTLKSMKNPLARENRTNAKFAVGAIATYIAMSMLNKAYSGQYMSENPEGKKDKLLIPLGDGYTLGIPYLSSIATVPRMAINATGRAIQGDMAGVGTELRKGLSMAIKPITDVMANMDYFENELVKETDTPSERLSKQATYLFKAYTGHPYIKELVDAYVKPEKPLYQRLSNALELPLRFYSTESVELAPFWDRYNDLKAVQEKYQLIAREDKDKATDYLNEHETDINEFNLMSAYVDYFYQQKEGGEEPTALREYLDLEKQPKKYETSLDAPQSTLDKTLLYAKSAYTNPIDTYNYVTTGQPIRKMRGDATVVEREIAKTDKDKNTQKDHRIPLWAGGDNSDKNTYYLSVEDHDAKTKFEEGLRKKLEAGTMNKSQVQDSIKQWHTENNIRSLMPPIKTPTIKVKLTKDDISKPVTKPTLTGNKELDKKLMSTYNGEITKKKNDIMKLYQSGELTADEAEKELAKLTTEKNKTSKKKAKKIKISATPKIAVTTSKSTYKPIKIRRTTAKKLKLSTIGKKQKIAKPDIKKLKLKLKV